MPNLPWNGGIHNQPEAFAEAAIELYQNKQKWQESQNNGFENTTYTVIHQLNLNRPCWKK